MQQQGLIRKATGGFYYVQTPQEELECRARGLFRKEKISPCVGDRVTVEPTEPGKGYVVDIAPRKNVLVRPPLANLDQLFLVTSVADPSPNLLVLDKMIAIALHKEIQPILVVTKCDLGAPDTLNRIYQLAGIPVYNVNNQTGEGAQALIPLFAGKISAFSGNTGVGKSSLLNVLSPSLQIKTGETSQKLGRGRHTTRHVELFQLFDGYVADTPGFSAVELERYEVILKDQLQYCFPEFAPYLGECRFTGCSHTCEKGCAVLQALAEGKIAPSRHESYCTMYETAKQIKEWEL